MQTLAHCRTLWLSCLTVRSAFLLSVNLTLQTLDAMCQNTLQRLSQNHANLPTCYRKKIHSRGIVELGVHKGGWCTLRGCN